MSKRFLQPVFNSRSLLPPIGLFKKKLEEIWGDAWLTNNGRQHHLLEEKLSAYLKVPYISLFNNGTTALMAAYKCLDLTGKVITTPFTFPATPHSLSWMGLQPVFCDIDEGTMNLDVKKIEDLITRDTTAILGVHLFGFPCDVKAIDLIARRHNLKVIYDAAHAFGVELAGESIAKFGDISMLSFHASKLFHTAEGGALIFSNQDLKKRAELVKNFGIEREDVVAEVGINGKMSELQAALGLMVLDLVQEEREKRKKLTRLYRKCLGGVSGIKFAKECKDVKSNYQYMPIRIIQEQFGNSRDYVYLKLREQNVYARRYFYPLCSDYPCYATSSSNMDLSIARNVSRQILLLPLHGQLEEQHIQAICEIIVDCQKNGGV